jgi:hypothetical protein
MAIAEMKIAVWGSPCGDSFIVAPLLFNQAEKAVLLVS